MSDRVYDGLTPSEILILEHDTIKRVLAVLQNLARRARDGDGWEIDSFRSCVEFFRNFADAFHHAKEEDLLFPALENRGIPRDGGPIAVMLMEHVRGREFVKQIADALEGVQNEDEAAREQLLHAADEFFGLLPHHIYKEDNILYPMGDNVLTEEDQGKLHTQYCEVASRTFGDKSPEELKMIADELEERWGDLSGLSRRITT